MTERIPQPDWLPKEYRREVYMTPEEWRLALADALPKTSGSTTTSAQNGRTTMTERIPVKVRDLAKEHDRERRRAMAAEYRSEGGYAEAVCFRLEQLGWVLLPAELEVMVERPAKRRVERVTFERPFIDGQSKPCKPDELSTYLYGWTAVDSELVEVEAEEGA